MISSGDKVTCAEELVEIIRFQSSMLFRHSTADPLNNQKSLMYMLSRRSASKYGDSERY